MLVTHKDGLPLSAPYSVDTILIGPGERYDMIIRANHDEGRFIFHDHVDKHVTAGGKYPGGPITIMEYAGTPMDDWYAWKDIKYDANFFYSESMKKGFGMFANPAFIGETIKRKPRHKVNNLEKKAAAPKPESPKLKPPKSQSTVAPVLTSGSGPNLLQERCAACHDLTGPAAKSITELKARKGPDLFYAGNKYRADWLADWLQKPVRIRPAGAFYLNHIKPGVKQDEIDSATLKPHLALTAKDAAAAAKALMALKANSKLLGTKPFTPGPAPMGEMSFDKFYGCAACHEVEPGFGGKSGPEVYTAGRRLTPEFMLSFIRDPQAWNPKGLMPNKHVPEANIPKLVNFLLERARENLK